MSILRQFNWLGQQRVDVPHLRALEASIAGDFDSTIGRGQAGQKALVVRGFELTNFAIGTAAINVQLKTADGIAYNLNASESGSFLWVPADRAPEALNSATNPRVDGSFTAGQVNYVGIDFVRSADVTTSDLSQFLDASTLLETPKNVPLGRTLDYRIVISTTPFSATPNLVPLAKIKTDSQNQVDTSTNGGPNVVDARQGLFRLSAGGDFPDAYHSYEWPENRDERTGNNQNSFTGGDKAIESQKDWNDAVMTRLWELGGGGSWFASTADRNVKMVRLPSPAVFSGTGDNFEFVSGAFSSTHLHWKGLKFVWDNDSQGNFQVAVVDQLSDDTAGGTAALSKTALSVGDCIYVDLPRAGAVVGFATVVAKKAALNSLGTPIVPGTRWVIAWRTAEGVYVRDTAYPVNTLMQVATTTVVGGVRLNNVAGTPATPTVPTLGTTNSVLLGFGSYPIIGNNPALQVYGGGNAPGFISVGGPTGPGASFNAGTSGNGAGAFATGSGNGPGMDILGGINGVGAVISAGGGFNYGLVVQAINNTAGIRAIGDSLAPGILAEGSTAANSTAGIFTGKGPSGTAISAQGLGTGNSVSVIGSTAGSTAIVAAGASGTTGTAISATSGSSGGFAVDALSASGWAARFNPRILIQPTTGPSEIEIRSIPSSYVNITSSIGPHMIHGDASAHPATIPISYTGYPVMLAATGVNISSSSLGVGGVFGANDRTGAAMILNKRLSLVGGGQLSFALEVLQNRNNTSSYQQVFSVDSEGNAQAPDFGYRPAKVVTKLILAADIKFEKGPGVLAAYNGAAWPTSEQSLDFTVITSTRANLFGTFTLPLGAVITRIRSSVKLGGVSTGMDSAYISFKKYSPNGSNPILAAAQVLSTGSEPYPVPPIPIPTPGNQIFTHTLTGTTGDLTVNQIGDTLGFYLTYIGSTNAYFSFNWIEIQFTMSNTLSW